MIKYNNSNINDWYFDTSNIIKVYRNNAVCYYKVTSGDTPTPVQEPCFAVVDDISQYSDTEFEDVFNKADNKWYKLNNLNQYEQYGIYGSGRTSCEGSASRLPQGYTEVEYIENPSMAYINSGFKPNQDTRILFTFKFEKSQSASMLIGAGGWDRADGMLFDYEQNLTGTLHISWGGTTRWSVVSSVHGDYNVHTYDWNKNEFYLDNTLVDSTTYRTFQCSDNLGIFSPIQYPYSPFGQQHFACGRLYDFKIYDNETLVRDFVPCTNPNDVAGLYDIVNGVFYDSAYSGYNFIAGDPITPTVCVTTYEGKLTIDEGYEYIYSGNSWVNVGEVSGSTATLPNVPFTVNYNAKKYDSSTKTLLKTEGQLANVDAVITAGTPTVGDGYLTIASDTRATIEGYQTYFNRDANNPNLTIISKQNTNGSNCHMFANRDTNYNWMYRCYSTKLTLHGTSEQGNVSVTTQPVIESVRIDGNKTATYNNYTDNTSSTYSNFNYGGTNSGKFAIFAGYGTSSGEWFVGDFYWIYMSQSTLTDEQVQQVIDYNEGGTQPTYPIYYDEIQDPPNHLSFSSMTEAESYECPWVGMKVTIDGSRYVFSGDSQSGYEWVYTPSRLPSGYTEIEYIRHSNDDRVQNVWAVPNDAVEGNIYTVDLLLDSSSQQNVSRFIGLFGWGSGYCQRTNRIPSDETNVGYRCSDGWHSDSTIGNYYQEYDVKLRYRMTTSALTITNIETSVATTINFSVNAGSSATGANFGVFAYNSNDSGAYQMRGNIYQIIIEGSDNTIKHQYIPCQRDSDSKYGLYDLIGQEFYYPTTITISGGQPV